MIINEGKVKRFFRNNKCDKEFTGTNIHCNILVIICCVCTEG